MRGTELRITTALDDVLASRGHVRVLRALDALPDGFGASVRDIARRARLAHPRTAQILPALTALGVTKLQRAGRADLYQLNRQHLLFPVLHELFSREAAVQSELEAFLRKRLPAVVPAVQEAYLFGSVARGESRPGSDIDLAVVVPKASASAAEDALTALADEVRTRFGNDLGVHLSTESLAKHLRAREGRGLWTRIAKEGIQLMPAKATARA